MCSSSSSSPIWNIFHSKENWAKYDKKCVLVFMWSALYYCPILMKPELSRKIFEKFPGVRRPRHGFDNPLFSSAEVKERVSCTSTPPLGLYARQESE